MTPSLTAQGVARARARMTRPSTTAGDPESEARLNLDLGADPDAAPGPLFHHLTARTAFFDALALGAAESGTTQIVIVGAGYDCRALRFRQLGVRFFELDHPATQHDKQDRLGRLGIAASDVAHVAIDLTTGDVAAALAEAGHDAAQRTLFTCEGLLLYLDVDTIARVFRGLRSRAEGRATLALSIAVRDRTFANARATARRAAFDARLRQIGEPPRTRLRRSEWDALLAKTGWAVVSAVDPHEIDVEASPGGALLVTAEPAPSESTSWT
jgi:methyltransferase (TIGR00027 family)